MDRLLRNLTATEVAAVIAAARSLKGTRWVHKGRTPRGVDCVGLCIYALNQIGVQCEDLADYSLQPDGVTLQQNIEKHLGAPVSVWRPGDIVLFRWHEKDGVVYSNHVGILSGVAPYDKSRWLLLHSERKSESKSVVNGVKEHALDGHWLRRIHAVYSLAGEAA